MPPPLPSRTPESMSVEGPDSVRAAVKVAGTRHSRTSNTTFSHAPAGCTIPRTLHALALHNAEHAHAPHPRLHNAWPHMNTRILGLQAPPAAQCWNVTRTPSCTTPETHSHPRLHNSLATRGPLVTRPTRTPGCTTPDSRLAVFVRWLFASLYLLSAAFALVASKLFFLETLCKTSFALLLCLSGFEFASELGATHSPSGARSRPTTGLRSRRQHCCRLVFRALDWPALKSTISLPTPSGPTTGSRSHGRPPPFNSELSAPLTGVRSMADSPADLKCTICRMIYV